MSARGAGVIGAASAQATQTVIYNRVIEHNKGEKGMSVMTPRTSTFATKA